MACPLLFAALCLVRRTPGDPGYRVAIDSLDFFTVLNPSALIANAVYNATDISLCPTTRTNAVVVKVCGARVWACTLPH